MECHVSAKLVVLIHYLPYPEAAGAHRAEPRGLPAAEEGREGDPRAGHQDIHHREGEQRAGGQPDIRIKNI